MGQTGIMMGLWAGVVLDLILDSATDPPIGLTVQLLLITNGVQMLFLLGIWLVVFVLMTRTRLFRAGGPRVAFLLFRSSSHHSTEVPPAE